MNRREESERLAAHADELIRRKGRAGAWYAPYDPVKQLLELAEQLTEVLVPVQPEPSYRRRLKHDLLLAAREQQARREASVFRQHRKGLLIGAAAIGSLASVIGVIAALIVRYRHGHASDIAAS